MAEISRRSLETDRFTLGCGGYRYLYILPASAESACFQWCRRVHGWDGVPYISVPLFLGQIVSFLRFELSTATGKLGVEVLGQYQSPCSVLAFSSLEELLLFFFTVLLLFPFPSSFSSPISHEGLGRCAPPRNLKPKEDTGTKTNWSIPPFGTFIINQSNPVPIHPIAFTLPSFFSSFSFSCLDPSTVCLSILSLSFAKRSFRISNSNSSTRLITLPVTTIKYILTSSIAENTLRSIPTYLPLRETA